MPVKVNKGSLLGQICDSASDQSDGADTSSDDEKEISPVMPVTVMPTSLERLDEDAMKEAERDYYASRKKPPGPPHSGPEPSTVSRVLLTAENKPAVARRRPPPPKRASVSVQAKGGGVSAGSLLMAAGGSDSEEDIFSDSSEGEGEQKISISLKPPKGAQIVTIAGDGISMSGDEIAGVRPPRSIVRKVEELGLEGQWYNGEEPRPVNLYLNVYTLPVWGAKSLGSTTSHSTW